MSTIARAMTKQLVKLAKQFPVIALTGPRQSGKTTLVAEVFADKDYVSLEEPDIREFAIADPRGFLQQFTAGAIIDEIQYAPQLFSYIQARVDKNKQNGEFVLTGSFNPLLLEKISQSLAGRVAILHLLPLSYQELRSAQFKFTNPLVLIQQGFYPRIYDQHLAAIDWCKNYINTYIERDVRQIKNITDLAKFQLFVKLCAGRTGQLLNMSSLASDCGIDHATVRAWLSVLEASFIIFVLRPHHKNFNKRLIKQPKLYFHDTGLACYLLGIHSAEELLAHHIRGSLFENFVISELVKHAYNNGREHNLSFWRDHHGHEVDVIIDQAGQLTAVEIKSTATMAQGLLQPLQYWQQLTNTEQQSYLVYAGDASQQRSNQKIQILSWQDLGALTVIPDSSH